MLTDLQFDEQLRQRQQQRTSFTTQCLVRIKKLSEGQNFVQAWSCLRAERLSKHMLANYS